MSARGWIAVVLLAVSVGTAVLGGVLAVRECDALLRTAQTGDLNADTARTLLSRWEKKSRALSLFLQHKDSDALSEAFYALRLSLDSGEQDRVRSSLIRLISVLRVVADGEKLKLENIL